MDKRNTIDTKTKLKDRIHSIEEIGDFLSFVGAEKDTMEYNLKLVGSLMLDIIGELLINFYSKRISKITDIINKIDKHGELTLKYIMEINLDIYFVNSYFFTLVEQSFLPATLTSHYYLFYKKFIKNKDCLK